MVIEVDSSYFAKIEKLEERCFGTPWSENALGSVYSDFGHIACDVDGDGELRGYIFFDIVFESAEILRLCVDGTVRRQGIGAGLVDHCIKKAREAGCSEIFLEVRRKNAAAIALYEKTGFVKISVRPGYYEDGDDALVYVLKL